MVTLGDSASSFIKQSNTQGAPVDAIRDLIFSDESEIGNGLPRDDLARTLNVSIIRIREALRQLQVECLVVLH